MNNMKAHFLQLLGYQSWAGDVVMDTVKKNPVSNERVMIMLNHIYEASRLWVARLEKETYPANIFKTTSLEEIEQLKKEAHTRWKNFLENTEDFEAIYTYKNLKGEEYSNHLKDIITHVFNHEEHHRAEIITLLKTAIKDIQIPPNDYIVYVRTK